MFGTMSRRAPCGRKNGECGVGCSLGWWVRPTISKQGLRVLKVIVLRTRVHEALVK